MAFTPALPDAAMGDWQGRGGSVAQVVPVSPGKYQALILSAFDAETNVVAVLQGTATERGGIAFAGDGWSATLKEGHLLANKGEAHLDLQPIRRTPPSLGAKPPPDAVVLFDGRNLNAWAKKNGKNWLEEDGPAQWKLGDDGTMEVVPGSDCLISHQKFGDCQLHLEFRNLGTPVNSGVYLQTRYEVNINETYGHPEMSANAGLDNCTEDAKPRVRPSLPPLAWQTLDIEFQAPRFDAGGKKVASARATVRLNGVRIYDRQELIPPHGAAGRLGEAATGPLMLQEHGMPVQFRNIWLAPRL